jgi:hypothetical protein
MSSMNRRHFLQAAGSTLFVPGTVPLADHAATVHDPPPLDHLFFDERFPHARRRALEWAGAAVPTPVQGDITALWRSGLGQAVSESSLTMRGVTTESFYFCLKVLAGERARLDTQVTRVDRDLLVWTISTGHSKANDDAHG